MRGDCLCGTIAFEIAGTLPDLYQCHCSLCRRQSGGMSNAATIVKMSQLTWLKGQDRIKTWIKDTGYRSDFCCECGSPVPNLLRDKPYYWVPAGLMGVATDSEVRLHLHLGSKADWDKGSMTGIQFEEAPSLEQIINLLEKGPDA